MVVNLGSDSNGQRIAFGFLEVRSPILFRKPEHLQIGSRETVSFWHISVYDRGVGMKGSRGSALDRTAASDLWRNTLSQIPSVFGRLVYLSSLRNPNSGRYEHHGLALVFGDDEASKALKKSHIQAFAEWLSFNLEQQKADLDLYLSALFEDKRTVLETWLKLTPYRNLIPSSVRGVERRLYTGDLTALIELLKNEYGVAAPDPDA